MMLPQSLLVILFGEIDGGVRTFESIEDLLEIRRVTLSLHTPSGFLRKAKRQKDLVEELKANPLLWEILDDEALMEILSNMSQKPTAELRNYFLPYLLRATNPAERVGVLMGMRRSMSESIFTRTLNVAKASLAESDWQKLKTILDSLIQVH